MDTFTVYSKANCQFCVRAKRLLDYKGLDYNEIKVPEEADAETVKARVKEAGFEGEVKSIPQIFCGEQYVGGFNELRSFLS